MAERPVWWQAEDTQSMLELLRDAANATQLDFAPRPRPENANVDALYEAAFQLAKERVAKDHSSQDRVLMEEVKAIDDVVRAANLMVERLREWHGLQDAETVRSASDAEALVQRVKEAERDPLTMEAEDHEVLLGFASALESMQAAWRAIETRVTTLMDDVAPNMKALVGPLVGARIITLGGGLQRLATFPAGTIQTLGAETALFRHIKEKTRPPKHGIIFQHPLVFQAKPWQRGSIARVMANHMALAARADATTRRDIAAELQASMEQDLARIYASKDKPPKRAPAKSNAPKGGRGRPQGRRPSHGGPQGKRGKGPRKGGKRP